MKILAFVDLHGNRSALDEIIAKSEKVDIVICAGDLSIFEHHLDRIVDRLRKIRKPVLVIHGNHETDSVLEKLCKKTGNVIFFHQKMYVFDGVVFVGHGGGGFSVTDVEFERFIEKAKGKIKGKKVVLVTHAPPHGTRLDKIGGNHNGNKSIRDFIVKYKPILAICGHFHENAGKKDLLKNTTVINPGPHGTLIDIA